MSKKTLAQDLRTDKMLKNIKENYRKMEASYVEQLYMKQDLHGTTIGSNRESIWKEIFEMIIPKKFVIEQSIFIIDSNGHVSHEVDLAIIDRMYTPYIFEYGLIKFVPIEAVAVVIECKSNSFKGLSDWKKCIDTLQTSDQSIARMATFISHKSVKTQKSTRPISILCSLKKAPDDIKNAFDIHIYTNKRNKKFNIEIHDDFDNLGECFEALNFHNHKNDCYNWRDQKENDNKDNQVSTLAQDLDISLKEKYQVDGINLLSLKFQLNQLLMLINNPMIFPHRAYVDLFNGRKSS